MADSLRQLIAEIQVLWGRIGLNQKIAMSVVITAVVAALAFWGSWNSNADYGLLFKNLQQKDAGEIINTLKADGISYRVEDNGSAEDASRKFYTWRFDSSVFIVPEQR